MIAPSYVDGHLVDLTQLTPHNVHIEEVAAALAKINRFNGRTPYPYSVAQHAVLVAKLAAVLTEGTEYKANAGYEGLHHDDTEAFTGDVISPMKRNLVWAPGGLHAASSFETFSSFENRIRDVVAAKFGLAKQEPAVVHEADMWALKIEQRLLQGWERVPERGVPDWAASATREMSWDDARYWYLHAHTALKASR